MSPRRAVSEITMKTFSSAVSSVLALLLAHTALAHEFWIQPSAFCANVGDVVKFDLRVGDHYPGESYPRNPKMIEKFILAGADGETEIVGQGGQTPAGAMKISTPGLYVVGYRSKRSFAELEAEKFETYLTEKGLENISKARADAGMSKKQGREFFSRCAKSILTVGAADQQSATGYDRVLGLRLELIPLANPNALKPGDSLPMKLLYENKPLANALVLYFNTASPAEHFTIRTDAKGEASIPLAKSGSWYIGAVEMVTLENDPNADVESIWASLTFDLPASESESATSTTR